MKIKPLDPHCLAPTQVVSTPKRQEGGKFSQVLERTMKTSPGAAARSTPRTAAVMPPGMRAPQGVKAQVYQGLEQLVLHLETYQHLLEDTQASLNAVDPAVRQLKADVAEMNELMDSMGKDDPLKQILNEALVMTSKEIIRFESGVYVDR